MTHPLTALIAGVPRYITNNAGELEPYEAGYLLMKDEVLAALEAAPVPDLVSVLEMSARIWTDNSAADKSPTFSRGDCREWAERYASAAAMITAQAAQIAGLEKDRDTWKVDAERNHKAADDEHDRAEAAEAKLDAIREIQAAPEGWDEVKATRALVLAVKSNEAKVAELEAQIAEFERLKEYWKEQTSTILVENVVAKDRAAAAEAKVKELEAAIDSQDAKEAGLWRFWSHKASQLATKNAQLMQSGAAAEAEAATLRAEVERLRGALENLETELTGVTPEPDNMQMTIDTARFVTRAALEGKA